MIRRYALALLLPLALCAAAPANPPVASHIFPAGGQRGTKVAVHVGGLFLHETCGFEMLGPGVQAPPQLRRTKTVWFEGPLLPLPDSQQPEDYPKDMAAEVQIQPDAPLGLRYWRTWTSQGATTAMKFQVGDLPEIVEDEIDGDPVPVPVTLPVTINGRIFPREDVDVWAFQARKGQSVVCEVHAARLGSPLDARLEIADSQGRHLAENEVGRGLDPVVRFTAPADGEYRVRIMDTRSSGGQAFVYRLTLTSGPYVERFYPLGGRRGGKVALQLVGQALPVTSVEVDLPASAGADYAHRLDRGGQKSNLLLLDVDDLPEHLEAEPNDGPDGLKPVALPAVLNGRIDRPGDVDCWAWTARKGEVYTFALRAAELASPLDGVLTIVDSSGKQLASAETTAGGRRDPSPRPTVPGDGTYQDPSLRFTVPADGTYQVQVRDRFRSRGGPEFAYRLRVTRPAADFRLGLQADAVTLPRNGQAKLKLTVERLGGFNAPIAVAVRGLPEGVTVTPATIAANQAAVDLTFKADAKVPIRPARLSIEGSATVGGDSVARTAKLLGPQGAPALETVLLALALPTPFQIKGEYEMGFAARGSVLKRRYKIERGGFEGPIEISLADRQARHLQGVTGVTVVVPAGQSEFTYEVVLPPWMETGRTSRTCVMGVATVKDADGGTHRVCFSSVNQNEQCVAVVGPCRLALELERTSLTPRPGEAAAVSVRIRRGNGLQGDVKLELIVPGHIRGVAAEPSVIAAGASQGVLMLRFAGGQQGLFNMPLTIRASLQGQGQVTFTEAKLDVQP